MRSIEAFPGWQVDVDYSEDGQRCDLTFYRHAQAVGHARLVIFDTFTLDDVLEPLSTHGDIWCVMDEVEQFLLTNPGAYLWLDGFTRTGQGPDVKGKLTEVLRECLTPQFFGMSAKFEVVAFPCPYGEGDMEDDPARAVLVNWYGKKLNAHVIEGTPFVRIPFGAANTRVAASVMDGRDHAPSHVH